MRIHLHLIAVFFFVSSFNSVAESLPSVYLTFNVSTISKEESVKCHLLIKNDSVVFLDSCYIHYRGATSLKYEKKNYALKLNSKKSLLGITKDDDFILDAMAIDRSRMRNYVAFEIWRRLTESNAPDGSSHRGAFTEGSYCELYVNGAYNGLYCFRNKVTRHLLGVNKNNGVIYKYSRNDYSTATLNMPDSVGDITCESWYDIEIKSPKKKQYSKEDWQPILDLLSFASTSDSQQSDEYIDQFFFRDNLVDYILFIMSIGAVDNFMHNTYLSAKDMAKDGRLLLTPWDLDGCLGRNGGDEETKVDEYSFSWAVLHDIHPFVPLLQDRNSIFYNDVKQRWSEVRNTVLSVESIREIVDSLSFMLDSEGMWEKERNRWNNNPVELADNSKIEANYIIDSFIKQHDALDWFLGIKKNRHDKIFIIIILLMMFFIFFSIKNKI